MAVGCAVCTNADELWDVSFRCAVIRINFTETKHFLVVNTSHVGQWILQPGLTMSYLWAEMDLEIQSQAILEISTWSWAAPHSCHIHWVDWMKLSISLLFGFQWRQNLAMVLVAARWQGGRDVLTVNVMMVMVVMLTVVVVSVAVVLWCSCALCCGTVRVVVTPGQSRLVTPQPARPQLGREKISCWGQPGVPVLSQPGNVINTNYLLLLLLSPRLTLTPGNGTKNIYHTLPVWWWDTLHSTPSWWLNNFSSIDKWHIIGYCKLHKW